MCSAALAAELAEPGEGAHVALLNDVFRLVVILYNAAREAEQPAVVLADRWRGLHPRHGAARG